MLHNRPGDSQAPSSYECLRCGNITTSYTHPVECPQCGGGLRNRAMAIE